jgi:hypothetical protein
LAGGVPGQGVGVEGIKGVKYAPMSPGMYENGKKWAVLRTFWLINCQKHRYLLKSILSRYTPETFFEKYINFKIFRYLRHCGAMPVQSFGNYIRPKPPG